MLNLPETLAFVVPYKKQRGNFFRFFLLIFAVFFWLEVLRNQVPEINLLQLVPGLYLFLVLFVVIILLVFISTLFLLPFELDMVKQSGTKTIERMRKQIFLKFAVSVFSFIFVFLVNIFLPLSLDSLISYADDNLENLWSFDEVLVLEFSLASLLVIISQFPVIFIFSYTERNIFRKLPKKWRLVTLLSFVFAGSLTPTIDALTQSVFAFTSILFYGMVILVLQKRKTMKFIGLTVIN